jgi:diguanylate cyclase
MGLFKRKKPVEITPEILSRHLDECRQRVQALRQAAGSLVFFLKEFPADIPEIGTDEFKTRLDQIAGNFLEDLPAPALIRAFSDHKLFVLDFISREKDYIQQKEAELKNIIELLRNGLSGLIGDTRDFNTRIYDQNVRMEALTQLDDIRKIKESLKTEVSAMKQIIQEKQSTDSRRIDSLSKEITILRSSLEQV